MFQNIMLSICSEFSEKNDYLQRMSKSLFV